MNGGRRDDRVWARRPPLTEIVYFFDFFLSAAFAAFAKAFAASFSFFAACDTLVSETALLVMLRPCE